MYGQTNMRIPYEWNTFKAFKPFRRFQLRFLLLPRARGGGLRGVERFERLEPFLDEVTHEYQGADSRRRDQ